MKRFFTVFFILTVFVVWGFAQVIDKPAATVRLEKLQVISVRQLESTIKSYEIKMKRPLTTDEKKKVLDGMINEVLLEQAAEKAHITVSDAEIQQRIDMAKRTGGIGLRLNRPLTDAELRSLVRQTGLSWEGYKKQLRKIILEQKYIMQAKRDFFSKIKEPTPSEIKEFYEENKTAFVSPEMVRFKHIFIDTRNLRTEAERAKARKRAYEIYKELENGASFDDLVLKYSDDKASRYNGGDFGYLRRDDLARKQLLGKSFFEEVFNLKVGQISGVLKSNIGYHIVKIEEKIPFKVLGLHDKIPPQDKVTVYDQIKATLYQQKQAQAFQEAMGDIVKELKKKAEIKIFKKNLPW